MVVGLGVLLTTVSNVESLLGLPPGSPRAWIIPGIIGVAALAGLAWGAILRTSRPEIYAGIGRGRPQPLAVLDQRLAEVEV